MDVKLYTPRAKNMNTEEKGLCLKPGHKNYNAYGDSLRYYRQRIFDIFKTNSATCSYLIFIHLSDS